VLTQCHQCFEAVGWAAGRASGLQKTEWWGAGVVICLQRGADLHTAQLMPLPLTVSCFSKIQTGFTFLVRAHPGSPGQRAVKRVCVYVNSGHFVLVLLASVVLSLVSSGPSQEISRAGYNIPEIISIVLSKMRKALTHSYQ